MMSWLFLVDVVDDFELLSLCVMRPSHIDQLSFHKGVKKMTNQKKNAEKMSDFWSKYSSKIGCFPLFHKNYGQKKIFYLILPRSMTKYGLSKPNFWPKSCSKSRNLYMSHFILNRSKSKFLPYIEWTWKE